MWFGNDNDSPMENVTGGTAPANLWKNFMVQAHDNLPPRNLKKSYVSSKSIDTQRKRIDEIIEKSRKLEKRKNVFEKILENFF